MSEFLAPYQSVAEKLSAEFCGARSLKAFAGFPVQVGYLEGIFNALALGRITKGQPLIAEVSSQLPADQITENLRLDIDEYGFAAHSRKFCPKTISGQLDNELARKLSIIDAEELLKIFQNHCADSLIWEVHELVVELSNNYDQFKAYRIFELMSNINYDAKNSALTRICESLSSRGLFSDPDSLETSVQISGGRSFS